MREAFRVFVESHCVCVSVCVCVPCNITARLISLTMYEDAHTHTHTLEKGGKSRDMIVTSCIVIYEGIIFVARRLIMANGRPREDGMREDSRSSTHAGRFLYWVIRVGVLCVCVAKCRQGKLHLIKRSACGIVVCGLCGVSDPSHNRINVLSAYTNVI